LWTLGPGEPKRLTRTAYDEKLPALSPQGDRVAYTTTEGRILILEAASGKEQSLEVEGWSGRWDMCSFSPDGSELACTYLNPQEEDKVALARIDIEQRQARLVMGQFGPQFSPAWSPDGSRIAFSADTAGNFDIWELDLETKRLTRLTEFPGLDESPAWGPDGKHVAFVSNRSGRRAIWVKALESGQLTELRPFGKQAIEVKDLVWR